MIKYAFYILLIFVVSCGSNNSKLSDIITASDCYWDIRDSLSTSLGRPAYCYMFKKDGKCFYFFYDKAGKRNEYDDDDVIVPQQWQIKDDTIYIRGIGRYITSYSKDTILLQNCITKARDTLIRNCR